MCPSSRQDADPRDSRSRSGHDKVFRVVLGDATCAWMSIVAAILLDTSVGLTRHGVSRYIGIGKPANMSGATMTRTPSITSTAVTP